MRRITKRKEQRLIEAYQQSPDGGRTLAKRFGVGGTTLYRVLRRNGIHTDPKKMKAPLGGARWKFTDKQLHRIAELYADGVRPPVLAERFECSRWTIRNAVRRHGLSLLRRGGQLRPWSTGEQADILRRIEKGESQEAVAGRHGTHQTTISRILRMAGRETRRVRERHGSWKGGRSVLQSGYVVVLVEEDSPYSGMRMSNGYVPEHRLVMAQKLGRPLLTSETVHHINGVRSDNRPENLQLWKGKHGKGVVMVCADCGSSNVVASGIRGALMA